MGDNDEDHPLYGIFSTLDVDGDGYLSRDDVTEALGTIGLPLSVDEIFEKLDPNNSGIIDFDQFIDGASLFTGGGEDDNSDEEVSTCSTGTNYEGVESRAVVWSSCADFNCRLRLCVSA